jgi:GTP-binding protein HflX
MLDRPKGGERAVLVHLDQGGVAYSEDLEEFQQLTAAAGAEQVALAVGSRRQPDPRLFAGSGKAEEIQQMVLETQAELVIFNHELSPSQERNLERLLGCRVVDRTGLILDIFAQRARSFEGKLQVELAQLGHLVTRLVRGWTHLERQKGGIGLRGPGETQLETDRRLIGQRIAQIRKRLTRVAGQRAQGRRARQKAELPSVSLVGYTNAGKSTLFNRLADAGVFVADQLFATLDPTLRRVGLPQGGAVILADTVGFISGLPHGLVAAFRATLEETTTASLLLHVVDAASPRRQDCVRHVDAVLQEIDADRIAQILVYNKIDLLPDELPRIERDAEGAVQRVWVSARTGAGIDLLLAAMAEHLHRDPVKCRVRLAPCEARIRALLFRQAEVLSEQVTDEGGWEMEVELARRDIERLMRQEQVLAGAVIA